MIDKKLEFAFLMKEAPKEIQDAATKFRAAYTRLNKAEVQASLWFDEVKAAEQLSDRAKVEFEKILNAWDPLKNKEAKPEELPVKQAETKVSK